MWNEKFTFSFFAIDHVFLDKIEESLIRKSWIGFFVTLCDINEKLKNGICRKKNVKIYLAKGFIHIGIQYSGVTMCQRVHELDEHVCMRYVQFSPWRCCILQFRCLEFLPWWTFDLWESKCQCCPMGRWLLNYSLDSLSVCWASDSGVKQNEK